jgi:hypothetical protein
MFDKFDNFSIVWHGFWFIWLWLHPRGSWPSTTFSCNQRRSMATYLLIIDWHYSLGFQIMHHHACTQGCSILVCSLKINFCNSLRFQIVHCHVYDAYRFIFLSLVLYKNDFSWIAYVYLNYSSCGFCRSKALTTLTILWRVLLCIIGKKWFFMTNLCN